MNENDTIRVALIGAGANTRLHHIPKLQAQPGVVLAGVVNRSRESSDQVARDYDIPRIYDTWLDAVRDPEIDAVVIGTWPYLHARATVAALEAGKHVLTEARLSGTAAEARAMCAAAQRRPDLVAQVVPAPFSFGVDRTVQRLLAEGYLGTLWHVEHRSTFPPPDPDAARHWRKDRDYSGFNVAMLGIVYEMCMRWVGEARSVLAHTHTVVTTARDEDGILRPVHVPDHVDVLAEWAIGASLHLQQSALMRPGAGDGTWLYGDQGVLRFHDGVLSAAQGRDATLEPMAIPAHEARGWRVEEEFIGAIRGREKVRYTTFEDGVKYMEFVEAVARSAAQGRRVYLPLALDE